MGWVQMILNLETKSGDLRQYGRSNTNKAGKRHSAIDQTAVENRNSQSQDNQCSGSPAWQPRSSQYRRDDNRMVNRHPVRVKP